MEMDSWVKILAGQGIAGLLLAIIIVFIWKQGWPTMKAHLDRCETDRKEAKEAMTKVHESFAQERKEARKEYTDSLRSRDVMVAEIHEKTVEALTNLSGEFRALRDDIKENK